MMSPSRRKMFVNVTADFLIDGTMEPKRIQFADGREYLIDRVKGVPKRRPNGHFPLQARMQGGAPARAPESLKHLYSPDPLVLCYQIIIDRKETTLYQQTDRRWFVLAKT